MSRPVLSWLFAGLLAAGTLAAAALPPLSRAAGAGQSGDGLTPVRFTEVIHSIFYLPHYVAESKGFFADEGLAVERVTAQGSDRGAAALLSGRADIALVGPETAVYVEGSPSPDKLRVVAQLTARDGSFLLARRPIPGFTWEDVRGRRIIGWRPGSMPELVLEHVLRRHGPVPGRDVEILTNVPIMAAASAFLAGRADFLTLFEPSASKLEQAGIGHVVASLGTAAGPVLYTAYLATDRFIREHPATVQAWVRAVHRAQRWVARGDPQEIAGVVAEHFPDTPIPLLAAAIRRYRDQQTWPVTPLPDPDQVRALQDLMVEGGVLPETARVGYEQIVVPGFARRAVREAACCP